VCVCVCVYGVCMVCVCVYVCVYVGVCMVCVYVFVFVGCVCVYGVCMCVCMVCAVCVYGVYVSTCVCMYVCVWCVCMCLCVYGVCVCVYGVCMVCLREKKTIYVLLFVITNAFIIFTHFPWVMFFTFEGLYALYFMYKEHSLKKKLNFKVIVAFLIVGLLYSTIIWQALTSTTDTLKNYGKPDLNQIARFGIQLSTWMYPTESMAQKINTFSFDFSFSEWVLFSSVLLFSLILSILFIFGIYISLKYNYKKESTTFLLFMFFIPLIFALVLSYVHPIVTVFQIKQLIYIIPAFLMLASVGYLRLKNNIVLISLLGLLIIPPIYAYYSNVDREQFKEAADFLPEDELIMIHTKTTQAVFRYYYGEKPNAIGVTNLEEVKQNIENKDNFWFLFTFLRYSQHNEEIKEFLNQNYRIIETRHFFGIDLINYKKN